MLKRRNQEVKEEVSNKILVNREELLEKISLLNFALSRKDIGKQTNHYIFMEDYIHVYNDEIYISVPFKMPISFSVEGDSFFKIIRSFFEEELRFEFSKGILKISSKAAQAKISFNKEIILSEQISDLFHIKNWKGLPSFVSEGIDLCGFSTSKDLTRGFLYCVAVFHDKIISTDDIRLSRFSLNDAVVDEGDYWLIPFDYSHLLLKFKLSFFKDKESWICFKGEDGKIFSIRKLKGNYPHDIDRFFQKKKEFIEFEFNEDFKAYLESIIPLLNEDLDYDKILRIKSDGKMLYCIIEKEFLYKERIFSINKKVSFNFLINPIFLKSILEKGRKVYIDIEGRRLYFYNQDFSHVLLLCLED